MVSKRSLAFIGARGIGNYGGFETFVKEVAPILQRLGTQVYCTCEIDDHVLGEEYEGARLKYFPIRPPVRYTARKVFETVYDNFFLLTAPSYADEIVLLGTLGAPCILFPRLRGRKVFVNIDGMEWRRDKFSKLEKWVLRMTFQVCSIFANGIIIDSRQLMEHVPEGSRERSVFIAYGVHPQKRVAADQGIRDKMAAHGLVENGYWLVIARLEPENNIHTIVQAYEKAGSGRPLVVVGNFTSDEYGQEVRSHSRNVVFLGHVYDQRYLSYLRQNCFAYIHGHSVGGTNPSLLEAMASDLVILAHDNGFNREVLEDKGLYFGSVESLAKTIADVDSRPEEFGPLAEQAKERVLANYSWEDIAKAYENLGSDRRPS